MKNNYKVITKMQSNYNVYTSLMHLILSFYRNNKVITYFKCNYKIITKFFIYYIVITFSVSALALTFNSDLMDGQLIFGHVKKNEKIFIENNYLNIGKNDKNLFQIPTDSAGRFAIGIPQDATELKLTIQTPTYSKTKIFPVHHRTWDEEYVTGLPPTKVQPDPENQKRITDEALSMRLARQQSNYPAFPEKWICPVPNFTRISSHFGSRRILNNIKKQGHSGTDLAAPVGSSVIAPADGKVVFVHPDLFLTGQTVMIDHGQGVFSSYSHMSKINVKINQIVKSGDSIGEVGQTGRATGPHLHWTITWYGVRVNPEDLILF